ncbi:MAG: zinc-binding alcohol dehydrogenase [Treponema sp.]|jgi:2-desacetyl-2-hydroxyethyl bacteriochlorophyllide A dehydrogenase|nr:zinc-binding alcohol dehydrogenase [Treponema sp.]
MLQNKKVVFDKAWEVSLHTEELDDSNIPDGSVLLKKIYSIISTGTELACLSGNEGWFKMPSVPGYACVGEIVKCGPKVEGYKAGDKILCYGNHSLYETIPAKGIFMPVPHGFDLKWVPFIRMATIAATAVRTSVIELGDYAAVCGQGLVGNMAMQLATLQGARVIAVDVADNRLEAAKKCGAALTINSASRDALEAVKNFTGGKGVSTLIDATGISELDVKNVEWVAQNGEMIFLGSPRGVYETNVTPFLNRVHLAPFNVTLKGAHEWKFPINKNPFVKHSLERNSELMFDLIARKKIILEPLLSEVASPSDCSAVYANLRDKKDQYMGVLFDWSELVPKLG